MPRKSISATARPLRFTPLLLAGLLALAPLAQAQEAANRIEQQMSPQQFEAAGLDQLSPEQLQNLNDWLNRTLQTETTKAAQQATEAAAEAADEDRRGLLNLGSREPIAGRLSGSFDGFGKGRKYVLDNGQVWQQIDSAQLVGVRLEQPQVEISRGMFDVWYLKIDGYNTRAKVQRIK